MEPLSVVIITKNESAVIERCLLSIKDVADEILVVDSGSTDNTAALAACGGAQVIFHAWEGFPKQKVFAVGLASHSWVLSLDADEELSVQAAAEIIRLKETDFGGSSGYNITRRTFFLGKVLNYGMTRTEKFLRLFNRDSARMSGGENIHEGFEVATPNRLKTGYILHNSYRSLEHYFEKFNSYTSLAARQIAVRKKRSGALGVAFKMPVSFCIAYIIRRGFLDGWPGFVAAVLHSFYSFVKYAKAIELQKNAHHNTRQT
jgi:glycosyltransferase involved in cell wall biosynthesis